MNIFLIHNNWLHRPFLLLQVKSTFVFTSSTSFSFLLVLQVHISRVTFTFTQVQNKCTCYSSDPDTHQHLGLRQHLDMCQHVGSCNHLGVHQYMRTCQHQQKNIILLLSTAFQSLDRTTLCLVYDFSTITSLCVKLCLANMVYGITSANATFPYTLLMFAVSGTKQTFGS